MMYYFHHVIWSFLLKDVIVNCLCYYYFSHLCMSVNDGGRGQDGIGVRGLVLVITEPIFGMNDNHLQSYPTCAKINKES